MRACTFTTEPMEHDVLICGLPTITLRVDGLSPEQSIIERVVIRLTDVDRAGRSTMITTCLATSLTAGERRSLILWPTTYRLAEGHRLRIAVSDSAFPWLVPLADPQPFRVADVSLRVPSLEANESAAIDVAPVPQPLSGMTYADSTWSIVEEPGRDGLGFKMWARRDYTVPQGHQLREEARSEASVTRGAPEDVVYRGERSIVATMRSGETIRVTARVHTTHGMMIADADVTVGDACAFTGQWRVPLSL
jgi:hypothetical protein